MYSRLAVHVLRRSHFDQNESLSPDDFFEVFLEEETQNDDDDNDDNGVVTNQPSSAVEVKRALLAEPEDLQENNNDDSMITVRKMTENEVTFAARLMVEAFRGKYEWTVGKEKLPEILDMVRLSISRCPSEAYEHRFIAFQASQAVGLITLVVKDDPKPKIRCSEAYSLLGCFRACRK
ncbi:uncharacterized protein LOC144453888 [Glandiceps talaboti]